MTYACKLTDTEEDFSSILLYTDMQAATADSTTVNLCIISPKSLGPLPSSTFLQYGRVRMIDFGYGYGRWQRAPVLKHRQTRWSSRSQSHQFGLLVLLQYTPMKPAEGMELIT